MEMYVVRYNDTEQGGIIRSEFFRKEDQIKKINECLEKGFEVIDLFEDDYEKAIKMRTSQDK
jgi:hypothetical protein